VYDCTTSAFGASAIRGSTIGISSGIGFELRSHPKKQFKAIKTLIARSAHLQRARPRVNSVV
jgi:hypothetical protein